MKFSKETNEAFDLEAIVKEFTPYVKTIINHAVGSNLSAEDKEEIVADTFFVLWKNQAKEITDLKAYIAGIARNLIKEKLRKRKVTCDVSDYENSISFSNVELFLEERNEIEKIEKSLANLKEVDFKIVTMFYYSFESIKEIAKELNISEINVKTRLFRIRQKIKKELGVGD